MPGLCCIAIPLPITTAQAIDDRAMEDTMSGPTPAPVQQQHPRVALSKKQFLDYNSGFNTFLQFGDRDGHPCNPEDKECVT